MAFSCPGCGFNHWLPIDFAHGSRWTWNESVERPTLSPSILMRAERFSPLGESQYLDWMNGKIPRPEKFDSVPIVCHSFVRDGRIEFLGDCTHALAGQTVDLKPIQVA